MRSSPGSDADTNEHDIHVTRPSVLASSCFRTALRELLVAEVGKPGWSSSARSSPLVCAIEDV